MLKSNYFLFPIIMLSILIISCKEEVKESKLYTPYPTEIGHEEGQGQGDKRRAWFETMHPVADGQSWKNIEFQTQKKKAEIRQNNTNFARSGTEVLANGNLVGKWIERGSVNQAGSVIATAYDPDTDLIYTIGAGGNLFRSPRSGNEWEVVNQDYRFNGRLLEFITLENGNKRLLALINRIPHYSDDYGLTWNSSTGIVYTNDQWGRYEDGLCISQDSNFIFLTSRPDYWDPGSVYVSTDDGLTFKSIYTASNYDFDNISLSTINDSDLIMQIKNNNEIKYYQFNPITSSMDLLKSIERFQLEAFDNINLDIVLENDFLNFYSYTSDSLFHSIDTGSTWTAVREMPANPWTVGLFISPSQPQTMSFGAVELFYNQHPDSSFIKTGNWWEYYDAVDTEIHADIMYIKEFKTKEDVPFILISNHGGLSITYDYFESLENLGLDGLTVSQYYSVRTDPIKSDVVYAGSQDQGFQRGQIIGDEIAAFDQIISGDYGHIVFTKNGEHLWTVYPDGWVTIYDNPRQEGFSSSIDLELDNAVWIPPLVPSADPNEDVIYVLGGNMDGDENASHIIKLTHSNNIIEAEQMEFDFQTLGVNRLSAFAIDPKNPNKWYVASTNGQFFYSEDAGISWNITQIALAGGQYLYGSDILISKNDPNVIYLSGSGYSVAPVWKSTNGGISFESISDGLPPTVAFGIASNTDESLLFAATEAGPYVYVSSENQWYDMLGVSAPNQNNWSVEFLEDQNLVRFGTYGRGIWDFQIEDNVSTKAVSFNSHFTIYPNPVEEILNIEADIQMENSQITIFDFQGKVIQSKFQNINQNGKIEMEVSHLAAGNYIVNIQNKNGKASLPFIKL